jgi:hypothetical protein
MTSTDKFRLPLRWQFVPVKEPRDGSIAWEWRAYTQAGAAAMQSQKRFETLTDCMADARNHGYDAT